jgi:hypothetical protein
MKSGSRNSFFGLPCCLSYQWKVFLVDFRVALRAGCLSRKELILFKLFVSALSFFRATSPEYSQAKFSTISGEFTGRSQELPITEIRQALKDLGISRLVVKSPSPF